VARWAIALGGVASAGRIAFPAELPRTLVLAEVKTTARAFGLVVDELSTCVRCNEATDGATSMCAVCQWLDGDGS
jgi:hypothetical protein